MEFDKIKEIIAEQLGVSEDEIAMETTFEDLGANDDAENIKTVGDAVEYVKNATNN